MSDLLIATNYMKEKFCVVAGFLGAFIINALGGWTTDLQTLVIFMVIDYMLGMSNALIFKTSPKTESGRLDSTVGFKGIAKKIMCLTMVVVAYRIDLTFNIDYIRSGVCVALIINELISMIETWKISGIKTPDILSNIVEVISNKEKEKMTNGRSYHRE